MEEKYSLPENWSPFVCTKESLVDVWEKFSQFPILFDDVYRNDFLGFVADFFNKNTIVLRTGDYGLAIIKGIIPYRCADIHLTFWDRRFKGRDTECKQALKWLFSTLGLVRATVDVPEIAYATIKFIKAIGFKREGVVRKAFMYKGRLLDLHSFGILREEVFSEQEQSSGGIREEEVTNGRNNKE